MMDFVYTHSKKNDALSIIKKFLAMIAIRYNTTIKMIKIDDEKTLNLKYDELIKIKKIISKRINSYISTQNSMIEQIEKILITKTQSIQIAASLSINK